MTRRVFTSCVVALSMATATPVSFAMDFQKRLEQLLAMQPTPLFVVLQPSGVVEMPPDVQRMADEMPARMKQGKSDAVWFDVIVLVATAQSPTSGTVLYEFKTRCAVLPASSYGEPQDGQDIMLRAMNAVVKLARDQRLDPKWGAMCVAGDEAVTDAYRRVMQFPPNGLQAKAMGKLVYLTSRNSSIMFAF